MCADERRCFSLRAKFIATRRTVEHGIAVVAAHATAEAVAWRDELHTFSLLDGLTNGVEDGGREDTAQAGSHEEEDLNRLRCEVAKR